MEACLLGLCVFSSWTIGSLWFVFEAFSGFGLVCILAFVWATEVTIIQDLNVWNLNHRFFFSFFPFPFFFILSRVRAKAYICTISHFLIPSSPQRVLFLRDLSIIYTIFFDLNLLKLLTFLLNSAWKCIKVYALIYQGLADIPILKHSALLFICIRATKSLTFPTVYQWMILGNPRLATSESRLHPSVMLKQRDRKDGITDAQGPRLPRQRWRH